MLVFVCYANILSGNSVTGKMIMGGYNHEKKNGCRKVF